MAEPDSASDNKNDAKDDKSAEPVKSLDQVHEIEQSKVEEDDADDTDNKADKGDGNDSKDDDAEDSSGDSGNDGDGSDEESGKDADDDAEEGDADDSGDDIEPPKPGAPKQPDTPAPELDSDITKPGEAKVSIKSADGKTYHFNNLAEVPDDFEPFTYKELMNGVAALNKKETKDEVVAEAKAEADAKAADEAETLKRTEAMQNEWEADASDLTSAGFFPKDPKKNEAAKEEVYDYIEAELKQGNIFTNFKQAYKSMMFDKDETQKNQDQAKINDLKKERGSVVQPGGTAPSAPVTNNRRGKVLEAPPSGAGLDAVHTNVINNL